MKKFLKTAFIVGLCGVSVVALAAVVLGKHRAKDAAQTLKKMAQSEVDEFIRENDNHDLRAELNKLRDEYPKQIALVKSQIKEIEQDLSELERDETRARDIVTMCDEDLASIKKSHDASIAAYNDAKVEFRGRYYDASEIARLQSRIMETREIYTDRVNDSVDERLLLEAERDELKLRLEELETERTEFEAEHARLTREIERMQRNEKMIKLAKRREGCEHDGHTDAMTTLEKVRRSVDRRVIEQQETLKGLRAAPRDLDYETRARQRERERKSETKRMTETPSESPAPTPSSDDAEIEVEAELVG